MRIDDLSMAEFKRAAGFITSKPLSAGMDEAWA